MISERGFTIWLSFPCSAFAESEIVPTHCLLAGFAQRCETASKRFAVYQLTASSALDHANDRIAGHRVPNKPCHWTPAARRVRTCKTHNRAALRLVLSHPSKRPISDDLRNLTIKRRRAENPTKKVGQGLGGSKLSDPPVHHRRRNHQVVQHRSRFPSHHPQCSYSLVLATVDQLPTETFAETDRPPRTAQLHLTAVSSSRNSSACI